ncbi:MAG: hypothetical protein AAF802_11440 [Planctomycetota bacterium]
MNDLSVQNVHKVYRFFGPPQRPDAKIEEFFLQARRQANHKWDFFEQKQLG